LSSSNAWAVGGYVNGMAEQTLIEHWNGRSWQRVASPNPGGAARVNDLESVTAISPSNAFAVGYYDVNGTSVARTLVEHWNGKAWKQQASPSPNGGAFNGLGGVAAASSSNAWATGSYFNGATDKILLEHWNGRSWKHAAAQDPGGTAGFSDLAAVAAVSRSSAWIVGQYFHGGPSKTLLEHWNGKAWKQQASPSPGGTAGSYLHALTAISSANAWAVGSYLSGASSLTLIEHWNGKAWRHVPSPSR
jgi:erythromycin esterase-like protein